ncbi:MAG: hypothetical protein ACLP6W_19665, partial [Bryobacteraceae bacterium]
GFHEYLQLAEDLGAEPLFCINVGMSHKEFIPLDRMAQWVQDALDAVEYANGPTDSVWVQSPSVCASDSMTSSRARAVDAICSRMLFRYSAALDR